MQSLIYHFVANFLLFQLILVYGNLPTINATLLGHCCNFKRTLSLSKSCSRYTDGQIKTTIVYH